MKTRLLVWTSAICLVLESGLAAREWVVDGANPAASDAGVGTAAAPFRTVQTAADAARAGDTVRVKAGLYRESVRLRHSGTAELPIRFVADPAGEVIINGADVLTEWRRLPGEGPIYFHDWPHQFAINHKDGVAIEHHPGSNPRFGRAEQVIADGNLLVIAENLAQLRNAWQERGKPREVVELGTVGQRGVPDVLDPDSWHGMFAVDTTEKQLYLWLAAGDSPADQRIEAATRAQVFGVNRWQQKEGVEHVHVRGFVFRYGASFPQRAIVTVHGRGNVMEDCVIDGASGAGLHVGGTARRCVIRRCGHSGGGALGDGLVNEDLLVEDNCWKPIRRGWDAGGAKLVRAHGGVVRRCVYQRNGGPGLWFDIDVKDIEVTESVFMDNEMSGLFVEISRDFHIHHNLFARNAVGSVRCGKWHDWGAAGLKLAESMNCLVEYNTLVGNKDGITLREQGPRRISSPDKGAIPYHNRDHVIRRNQCVENRDFDLGLWYDNPYFGIHPSQAKTYDGTPPPYEEWVKTVTRELYDPRRVNLTIDRNVYGARKAQARFLFGCPWREKSREFGELSSFVEVTGFEKNGIVRQVRFADREKNNYRLQGDVEVEGGWQDAPAELDVWIQQRVPSLR